MKRTIAGVLCILLAVTCFGCGSNEQKLQGDFYFDASYIENQESTITVGESSILFSKKGQRGKVILPNNEKAQNAINDQLNQVHQGFLTDAESEKESAQTFLEDMALWGEGAIKNGFYSFEQSVVGCHYAKNVISIVFENYSYTMGAHGYTYRHTLNFSMEDGHLLNSAEVFHNNWQDQIGELVNQQIISSSTQLSQGLFEDYQNLLNHIAIDRIYFAEDGLHVIYDTYILAPYAAGILEFTIPYKQVQGILKDEWVPQFIDIEYESASAQIAFIDTLENFDGRNALAISLDKDGTEFVISTEGKIKNPALSEIVVVETDVPMYQAQGVDEQVAPALKTNGVFQLLTCYERNIWFQGDVLTAENPWVIKDVVSPEQLTLLFSYDSEGGREHYMITQDGESGKLIFVETSVVN